MGIENTSHRRYFFGEFVLDVDRGALLAGGAEVRLRPQSFDVLRYLVENHGRLVTRDELLQAIWGDTVVTEGSLTQCLIDARRAIGDKLRKLIRTVPRRGYIFDAPVSETGAPDAPSTVSPAPATSPKSRRWALPFGFALVFATAAAWWGWAPQFETSDEAVSAVRPDSIAVLPFVDMSEAQDQGYFSDGIAEEILNTLAESPDLKVIARTSSFSFKGKQADIATIAEALGVAYVLEGSVRRSDNLVRVTAQLVDAATSVHLWSDTYDRDPGNVLAVQSDIAAAVADALKVTLAGDAPPPEAMPISAAAYELYLQGRFFHNRRAPGDSERAGDYYRQALEIDPAYGRAWAGLAGALLVQSVEENSGTAATRTAWREAVEQALKYAPGVAEVHARAAQHYWHTSDFERAANHRRQAVELGPNDPLVLSMSAGDSAFRGRLDEAVAQQQRAVELDPLAAVQHNNLAHFLAGAGRFDEALAEQQIALDLNPSSAPLFEINVGFLLILQRRLDDALRAVRDWPEGRDRDAALAMVHGLLGHQAEADAAFARLVARPGVDVARSVAEVHAWRGEIDEAFKWLAKGNGAARTGTAREHATWVDDARLSPFLIPLREDRRWEQALAWDD